MTPLYSKSIYNKISFSMKKRVPYVAQSQNAECGYACLAMILGYYEHSIALSHIRNEHGDITNGSTLVDLMRIANSYGLRSNPVKVELEDIKDLELPCILHWGMNHFVVLSKISRNKFLIHDPAVGEENISIDKLSNKFTGIALELAPSISFEKKNKVASISFESFWSQIFGLKSSFFNILLLSITLQIVLLISPYFIQLVIDEATISGDINFLNSLLFIFVLLLLFEVMITAVRGLSIIKLSSLLNAQLGANVFNHLIRLPISFFSQRNVGDVISRFGSVNQINKILSDGLIESIVDGFMIILIFCMMVLYSWELSLIVLIALSLYVIFRVVVFKPFRKLSEKELASQADETSFFIESIRGIQTIRTFNAESIRESAWHSRYAATINCSIKLGYWRLSFQSVNRFLFGLENIVVIYLSAFQIINNSFTVGMLFAFMAYKNQFFRRAEELVEKFIDFKMLGLQFERLSDIVLNEKDHSLIDNKPRKIEVRGSVRVDRIGFNYTNSSQPIFSNLSFEVTQGEFVSIVGPSGIGKSTLLKLLVGLYKPTQGEIFVDEIPISEINYGNFREQVACIMQDDSLLSGSVIENITFFCANYEMEDVIMCAKQAFIHDEIIRLPMGYHTLIGDMGSSFSGGQKQRLILARALYKNPRILFMDEATSHLDSHLEISINESLKRMNITRISIAHREETINSADRIIDLNLLCNRTYDS